MAHVVKLDKLIEPDRSYLEGGPEDWWLSTRTSLTVRARLRRGWQNRRTPSPYRRLIARSIFLP
jgi:hypothetical protein